MATAQVRSFLPLLRQPRVVALPTRRPLWLLPVKHSLLPQPQTLTVFKHGESLHISYEILSDA